MTFKQVERLRNADILVLMSLLWFVILFLRYILPPLFPTFQEQYAITTVELGLAYSGLLFAYAVMQFPAGWVADRVGEINVITAGGLVFVFSTLLIAISTTWAVLLGGILLIGLGTGGHKILSIPLLSKLYTDSQGRTLGVMDMVGQFGGVLAPSSIILVDQLGLNWRVIFTLTAMVSLAFVISFHVRGQRRVSVLNDEHGEDSDHKGSQPSASRTTKSADGELRSYLKAFFRPRFLTFLSATVCISMAWNGLTAFLPLYLTTSTGFTSTVANIMFGLLFAVSFTQPLIGELSDRLGQLFVMCVVLAVATTAAIGLVLSTSVLTVALSLVGVGIGLHGFRPVRDAYLNKIIPSEITGGVLGIARTVLILSGSAAPFLVSVIADTFGFTAAFGSLAGVTLAATLLVVGLFFY